MNEQDDTIATLNKLIGISKDGHKGFANAAQHAERADLKALFSSYSAACAQGATELQALVSSLGGKPETDGTLAGTFRRGLTDVKAKLSSHTDHAILEECEKGEDVAKKAYADALRDELPDNVRAILTRQNQEVVTHHDRIRDLRDEKATDLRN